MQRCALSDFTRFYFGHHKCASQYIKTILRSSAIQLGWTFKVDGIATQLPMDYHLQERFAQRVVERQTMLAQGGYDLICLENADNDALAIIEAHHQYRGFHVIRDPRDIVVSGYFSHRYSHPISEGESPWLAGYREHLASLSTAEEGLLAEIEFCATYFKRLCAWNYANPRVLEVKYEQLIAAPLATFMQIYAFLGIAVPAFAPLLLGRLFWNYAMQKRLARPVFRETALARQTLQLIIRRHTFEHKAGGRKRGEEDVRHHYRKGVSGDWHNYFTPRLKDAFKLHYPGLMEKLGYETDDNW